jgi:hypothetical protein
MQTATETSQVRAEDPRYERFLRSIQERFDAVALPTVPLFTTDADGLFDAYLATFPETDRQHYNCNACRRFLDTFGGIVAVDPSTGAIVPALWDDESDASRELARLVRKSKITGAAVFDVGVWGQPKTGEWSHMAVRPPARLVYRSTKIKNASQHAAEKREEHGMICRGLAEFPIEAVQQAVTMLETDALYRSEKVLGVATWLRDLHGKRTQPRGANLVWLATATAPVGFAHVRSSMIGTLLEDIVAGLPFDEVARKFRAKMAPTAYQRPQAAPSAGAIAQAEKVFAEMGLAPSLVRRFARLSEVVALWKPAPHVDDKPAAGGVFGHIAAKGAAPKVGTSRADLPPIVMTWAKFARTVLPNATAMEFKTPAAGGYFAFLTASDADAPPILQWDRIEKRNPVSMYVYSGGSSANQWKLPAASWVQVTALANRPSRWDPEAKADHHGDALFFVLTGAVDTRDTAGNALFPETLRSELHGVRSVIEAYSRTAKIEGRDVADACGICYSSPGLWADCVVRVTDAQGITVVYRIDRWD